jgi:hypothetical protein
MTHWNVFGMRWHSRKAASLQGIVDRYTSPEEVMITFARVLPLSVPADSTCFTTSIPSATSPNTTCLPSSQGVTTVVMKNWYHLSWVYDVSLRSRRTCEPLVLGPALAMDKSPGRMCLNLKFSSIGAVEDDQRRDR